MERKFEILIVDDDVHLASNIRRILEVEGYNTMVTHDGQTALALCREKTFDLALIDIELPSTLVLELILKLAKLSPLMEYIVIIGHASLETTVEVTALRHLVAYETKPLNMYHLLSLIIQVVERKQLERKMVEYEELDKLKSDLLSTVSHELYTPLAIFKGYSTMLVDYNRRLRPRPVCSRSISQIAL